MDVARGSATRVSSSGYSDNPTWSPNGQAIAYASARELPPNVYVRRLNGSEEAWTALRTQVYPGDWTPDGKSVVGFVVNSETKGDICVISSGQPMRTIIRTTADEVEPAVSPDGRWVAYQSDETGKREVFVTSLAQPSEKWQVSAGGGSDAVWSADGKELLFLGPADAVMSVPIAVSGDAVEPGSPVKLFEARVNDLTVARDGRLLLARAITPVTPPMQVLLNWRALVEQKP